MCSDSVGSLLKPWDHDIYVNTPMTVHHSTSQEYPLGFCPSQLFQSCVIISGKSTADGLIGRTSQFLYTAVSAHKEDLPDVASLYIFCKQHWKEKNEICACKHYERNFLTTEIARPTDVTTNTLPGTKQIHSIRSVGMEGIVEVRESSCFCINCRGGHDVCKNKHLVLPWQKKNLLGSVDTENIKHHWQDVYKSDVLDEKPEQQKKTCPPSGKRSKSQDNCPEITLPVKHAKHDVHLKKIHEKKQQNKGERSTTVVKNVQSRNHDVRCSAWNQSVIQLASTPTSETVGTSTTISTATSLKITYWQLKQEEMSKCNTYEELEDLVRSVNVGHHFELSENVHHAKMKFEVDTIAQHFYPSDALQVLTPCKCHGDGNCFIRCVSKLLFGTEDHHLAICATLVYEAIIHKNFIWTKLI